MLAQTKHSYELSETTTGVKQHNLNLEVPAGKLTVKATTNSLVQTRIDYDRVELKPKSSSSKKGDVATLTIKQEGLKNNSGNIENNWDVNINRTIPLALHITLGAGDAQIDLSNTALKTLMMETGAGAASVKLNGSKATQVEISTGVGELNLDLTGSWDHNLNVEINGGIGSMRVKVPKNTGVIVKANMLGNKNLSGFTKSGGQHRNSAYGKTKNTITLEINGGLGSVDVTEV